MNLMNNSYLLFDTIPFDGKLVRNITKLCLLPDIPAKYFTENYTLNYKCSDDVLLEAISFELYQDTSYWDILMVMNGITNMKQLPVNGDVIFRRAEKALDKWVKVGQLLKTKDLYKQYTDLKFQLKQGNPILLELLPDDDNEIVRRKYLDILEEEQTKNEIFRTLKYITISDISELMANLNILKSSPKINENIIIIP